MVMPVGLRKLVLATHLTVSTGWLGAVAAYLVLDVTVATSTDPALVRGAWLAMGLVVSFAVVPLAISSLASGIVMALGTRWGLFRHWWVLISFVLTVVATGVLLAEVNVVRANAEVAAAPMTVDSHLLALRPTIVHSVGGLVVLLLIQVLNVYKPPGLTPYGWRKLQEERRGGSARPVPSGGRAPR